MGHRYWPAGQLYEGPNGRQLYGKYQDNAALTLPLVWQHAPGFDHVLHAGGHLGFLSLALASRFALVDVFEAAADNCVWLCANTAQQPRIRVTYGALGDGQPVDVVRHKYSATHHVVTGGAVPCYRIDDLPLDGLDVLLLDLEGGELVALQHAQQTLRRWHPLLVVEEVPKTLARYGRHQGDVAALLAPLGYRPVGTTALDVAYRYKGIR